MFGSLIGLGVNTGLGLIGAHKAAKAAHQAADAQVAATQEAGGLTKQYGQNALTALGRSYNDTQWTTQPWLQAGRNAIGQLEQGNNPGGELAQRFDGQTLSQD